MSADLTPEELFEYMKTLPPEQREAEVAKIRAAELKRHNNFHVRHGAVGRMAVMSALALATSPTGSVDMLIKPPVPTPEVSVRYDGGRHNRKSVRTHMISGETMHDMRARKKREKKSKKQSRRRR